MSLLMFLWLAAAPSPAAEPGTEDLTLLARHLEGYPGDYEAFKSSASPLIPDDPLFKRTIYSTPGIF